MTVRQLYARLADVEPEDMDAQVWCSIYGVEEGAGIIAPFVLRWTEGAGDEAVLLLDTSVEEGTPIYNGGP